jgi:hypothetical protein
MATYEMKIELPQGILLFLWCFFLPELGPAALPFALHPIVPLTHAGENIWKCGVWN